MRPAGHRFETVGINVGPKPDPIIDPRNDLAEELAQFSCSVRGKFR